MEQSASGELRYIGDIRGTHIGTGHAEFKPSSVGGIFQLELSVKIDGDVDTLRGVSRENVSDVFDLYRADDNTNEKVGEISFNFRDIQKVTSTWSMLDGAKGIANWSLVSNTLTRSSNNNDSPKPEADLPIIGPQLINKEVSFNAATISRTDIEALVSKLEAECR